ncbi:hypothetical protein Y1Q_0008872 [Alligator mississippiensis]|uniref:Uncharacterized protein n=1 Tax=Alligator mississippiensis TaxID=8496 RepID=A0A151NAW4_ALLMI|nr:hypothetical protein Y1Q_0008872 [Alligator mississippiensis]
MQIQHPYLQAWYLPSVSHVWILTLLGPARLQSSLQTSIVHGDSTVALPTAVSLSPHLASGAASSHLCSLSGIA